MSEGMRLGKGKLYKGGLLRSLMQTVGTSSTGTSKKHTQYLPELSFQSPGGWRTSSRTSFIECCPGVFTAPH